MARLPGARANAAAAATDCFAAVNAARCAAFSSVIVFFVSPPHFRAIFRTIWREPTLGAGLRNGRVGTAGAAAGDGSSIWSVSFQQERTKAGRGGL